MKSCFLALIQILLFCSLGQASYLTVTAGTAPIDFNKRTHIIVSSRGSDLGELPMQSALSKASRFAQVMPEDQVVTYIITTADVNGQSFDAMSAVQQFSLTVNHDSPSTLDATLLLTKLNKFTQIASFEAFGHSGIAPGLFLDGVGESDSAYAWTPFFPGSASLKSKFTADAFAIFHGCNSGHLQSLTMAKAWGIPVAGGFTTAHFEEVSANGFYYWSNEEVPSLNANLLSMRMKSDDVPYIGGYYGTYLQALPFFKFFCDGISQTKCLTGIGMSVYSVVTAVAPPAKAVTGQGFDDYYLSVVREWLCPSSYYSANTMQTQEDCQKRLSQIQAKWIAKEALSEVEKKFMPFRGRSLQCKSLTESENTKTECYPSNCGASTDEMDGCAKKSVSTGVFGIKVPVMVDQQPEMVLQGATTLVDEYAAYFKALELVRSQKPSGFLQKPSYLLKIKIPQ